MMKNETGRSMVEMLGVLAIIGVLSVAGIAGYTMAMKKYKANEILNAASQAVILAQTYNQGEGITADTNATDLGMTSASIPTYVTTLSVAPPAAGSTAYQVTVEESSGACEVAAQNVGTTYTISCS